MENTDDLRAVVKELRSQLGLSQTDFGRLIGKGIATIQRYEALVPPRGKALADIARLAESRGKFAIASVFRRALRDELGSSGPIMMIPEPVRLALEALYQNLGAGWVLIHLESLIQQSYRKGTKHLVGPNLNANEDPEVHRQFLRAILSDLKLLLINDRDTVALAEQIMPLAGEEDGHKKPKREG